MGKNGNKANRTRRKAALALVLPSMLVLAFVFASFSFVSSPTIHSASVEPQKVRPGDIMLISAQVSDLRGRLRKFVKGRLDSMSVGLAKKIKEAGRLPDSGPVKIEGIVTSHYVEESFEMHCGNELVQVRFIGKKPGLGSRVVVEGDIVKMPSGEQQQGKKVISATSVETIKARRLPQETAP